MICRLQPQPVAPNLFRCSFRRLVGATDEEIMGRDQEMGLGF
jgi:hypothetical protein